MLGSNSNLDLVGSHKYDGDWKDRYSDKPGEKRKRKKSYKSPPPEKPYASAFGFGEEIETCEKCGHAPHEGRCPLKRQVVGLAGEGEHDLECRCGE